MNLSTLERSSGLKDKARRLGRGNASKWNYAWKGLKWQKARSGKGSKIPAYFEWGQTPLYMRIPKQKWFKRYYKLVSTIEIVNIADLDRVFLDGDLINNGSLFEKWLVNNPLNQVKILWNWSTTKKFEFDSSLMFSQSAEKLK